MKFKNHQISMIDRIGVISGELLRQSRPITLNALILKNHIIHNVISGISKGFLQY